MRTNLILSSLVVLGLLSLAAGAALAQPGGGEQRSERAAAFAEMREARNESLRSFHENRTAAIDALHAANNATRASFLENKTRVIDECRAARNATADDNNSAFAQCVRDGLKPLIEAARAAHADAREDCREALIAARENAKAAFAAARADARSRHNQTA